MSVRYELISICPHTKARRGRLHTPHGTVETPCFMPVGTQGSVKTVGSEDLEALGFELILSNTYHLALRPGESLVQELGGLHQFMSWKGSILTDSGGYQAMSLSHQRTVTEEGYRFKSHLDGSDFELTPERAIGIQSKLGVDMSMCLDVCPPYPCTRDEAAEAMARTHRWAARNLAAREGNQAIFGIVQGGVHEDLRRESAEAIGSMDFDGIAIGGVSVGEPTEMQYPVVQYTAPLLPANKARYLMGVGHPGDIIHAVTCGVDMFDCVLPTRMARHNCLYTMRGRINAMNEKWARHDGLHDPECEFVATSRYSAAYLRHLLKAKEALGARIATLHNLAFYARLMQDLRYAIETGSMPDLQRKYARA